jgi:hypothetical protein
MILREKKIKFVILYYKGLLYNFPKKHNDTTKVLVVLYFRKYSLESFKKNLRLYEAFVYKKFLLINY